MKKFGNDPSIVDVLGNLLQSYKADVKFIRSKLEKQVMSLVLTIVKCSESWLGILGSRVHLLRHVSRPDDVGPSRQACGLWLNPHMLHRRIPGRPLPFYRQIWRPSKGPVRWVSQISHLLAGSLDPDSPHERSPQSEVGLEPRCSRQRTNSFFVPFRPQPNRRRSSRLAYVHEFLPSCYTTVLIAECVPSKSFDIANVECRKFSPIN